MEGYVHSIYSGGMVDGPGIRCVVFLSGCPLRCKYCHNPDSWMLHSGKPMTVTEVMDEILKYKSYYKTSGGGVTVSGGEPFIQAAFLTEILKACKAHGIPTALDTSGYANIDAARGALKYTDLLLLDVKAFNPETYRNVTGVEIDKTLGILNLSREMGIPTWVRYVLVPGLTDDMDEIRDLSAFLKGYDNVKKIEVLPFHKAGEHKWEEFNIPYELGDTPPPAADDIALAKSILEKG